MKTLLFLAALALPIAGAPPDARGEYEEILTEYKHALLDFEKQCAEIEKDEGAEALAEYRDLWHPGGHYVAVFQEKAKEYEGTKDAVRFLEWLVFNAPTKSADGTALPKPSVAALATLLDVHPKQAASTIESLPYETYEYGKERCLAVADAIVKAADDDVAVANARLTRASVHMTALPAGTATLAPEEMKACVADAKAAIESGNAGLVANAKRVLFELENLQIGDVAPEIAGSDTDGISFKLSDYRGKVVMLDFWGDW